MKDKIFLFESYSDDKAIKEIEKVIRRGTHWSSGPEVKEFENKIAEFTGRKYAISFNSGTSALYVNLLANKINFGEVIVPSFTFPATVNSVIAVGAKPVFADIEPETLGLDVNDVERKINPQTKAIMPIHFAGDVSKDIKSLEKIAGENNMPLIEDNAHSIGAKLNGEMAGCFGDSAMLSFCFNKVLPLGEGGMIITDSEELAKNLKLMRSHGRDDKKDYVTWGLNFRMPTIIAALGLSQFKKLDFLIDSRRKIAELYNNDFKDIQELRLPNPNKGHYCVYQLYNLIFKTEEIRDKFVEHMAANDIPTRVTYNPVHLYTYFRKDYGCKEGDLPVTEEISKRILTIPSHPNLKRDQIHYIIEKTKEFFKP